ncbi:MAG: hypothetical protein AAGB19_21675, partial [Cyanobacteria bacterium P01_F01_bin.3]
MPSIPGRKINSGLLGSIGFGDRNLCGLTAVDLTSDNPASDNLASDNLVPDTGRCIQATFSSSLLLVGTQQP